MTTFDFGFMAFVLKNKKNRTITIDQRVNLQAESLLKESTGKTTMAWLLGNKEPSEQLEVALDYFNNDSGKRLLITACMKKELKISSTEELNSLIKISSDKKLIKLHEELVKLSADSELPTEFKLAEVS